MKKFTLLGLGLLLSSAVVAQVSVSQLSIPYTQNFDTLSDTTLTNSYNTLPAGWKAEEYGSGANTQYRAAWGQLSGGDLYSFGDSAIAERALGSLGSGTVAPVYFGVALVNNTGSTVQNVVVQYRGELWRVGNPARTTGPDSLHFAWGTNNGDLHSNVWNSFTALNYVSPAPASGPSNVQLNGNAAAQVTNYLDTLLNINLAAGDTLWLRWRDENSSSFDDGMGIDDVSITFLPSISAPASLLLSFSAMNTYYYQNFDSLGSGNGSTYNFSTLPFGWLAKETGSNGDNTYRAAYGELAGGNLYSFGDSASSERALGSIGSGTNNKTHFGAAFINNTGQVINNVEINYRGEMWRQGRPQRSTGPDTLHFSYTTHAAAIDTGSYIAMPLLDFFAPVVNGILNTPMDGNLAPNYTDVIGAIGNLNMQPGDTLWVRWTDFDSDSYDDGLGIDSFSIVPVMSSASLNMEFVQSNTTIQESDGIISIPIHIHNKSNFLSQVEVFIADTGTIDLATDVNLVSSIVSFPGYSNDTVAYFQFGVTNSQPFEGNEYFVLGLTDPINGFVGATVYDTIYINNYQYPQVPLADLSGEDVQGIADSINNNYLLEGVVHGVNYSANGGLDFYIIENGSGINVYQPPGTQSSYQPTAGDKVKVWGAVGQYRGLTRIEMPDSIQLVNGGNALEAPQVVIEVTEAEESSYLKFDSLKLYPAIATWPNNMEVYAVSAITQDTVAIYISTNTDLAGTPAPSGYFSLVGIGSQFNNDTQPPYDNGYRIMAVNKSLVTLPTGINGPVVVQPLLSAALYPNPFTDQLSIQSDAGVGTVSVYSADGKCIWQKSSDNTSIIIPTASWKQGIYLVQQQKAGVQKTYKAVKF